MNYFSKLYSYTHDSRTFLVVQLYLQFSTIKSEERRLEGRDLELWMDGHSIPENLRNGIRQYQRYKREENRAVDVENLFRNLPKSLGNKLKYQLCLGLLKRVWFYQKS